MNKKKWFFRTVFYLLGQAVLAFGICLNKKTMLGISPIVSVADCVSTLTISKINFMTLSNATFLLYAAFVLAEVIIHTIRKKYKEIPLDLLQIVVSLVFTRFMSIFDKALPVFTTELEGTVFSTMYMRLIFLAIAIILTGMGAALSLNARLVPNPGDGIVQAIADTVHKSTGFTKNCVDISCVAISTVIGLIATHSLVSVGLGTVIAMIGVGRVIAVFNKFTKKKIAEISGVDIENN